MSCSLGLPTPPTLAQVTVEEAVQLSDLEPGAFRLQAEMLQGHDGALVLGNEPWRYQAGDDPVWADPAFDDTNWDLLKPDMQPACVEKM